MYKQFRPKTQIKAPKMMACGQPTTEGPCFFNHNHENPCQSKKTYDRLTKGTR